MSKVLLEAKKKEKQQKELTLLFEGKNKEKKKETFLEIIKDFLKGGWIKSLPDLQEQFGE